MTATEQAGLRPVRLGALAVAVREGEGGVRYLDAQGSLPAPPASMVAWLAHWAAAAPDRTFLADRVDGGPWRTLSFAEARARSRAIAAFLLGRGLSAERPVVVLSGNSVEHGLLALGAMTAGVPFAPVSPAYSLVSRDFAKLAHVMDLLTPGLVFVADAAGFEPALRATLRPGTLLAVARNPPAGMGAITLSEMEAAIPGPAVDAAEAALGPATVAKFLFTSGSTGLPKAVINTQGMMTANQEMIRAALAFLADAPPVLVDWLPWNHTAGGNHNFGIALANGGTLWIDDGAPTAQGIGRTVRNLAEVSPTLYFNVPKGYEMLVAHLEADPALRTRFFAGLKLLQYSGAGLAQHVWDALERLAVGATGERVMIITGYGATETAPFALTTTWPVRRPGEIGLPAPGLSVKLVPSGEKTEIRLRGPNITPGYWRAPDATAAAFDAEGYYRMGDAVRLADPADPSRGLLFDGRVSEDFKLSTGTWVNMAAVRGALVRAFAPFVRDAVLTGLDRDFIGALLILDPTAAEGIDPALAGADEAAIAAHPATRALFQSRLDALAATATGSSTLVRRALVLPGPLSLDRGEITDKGSTNQRVVIAARPDCVADLYAEPPPARVIAAH